MRAVVQRVSTSQVMVDNKIVGKISKGLTVLLGVENGDNIKDAEYMAEKIAGLRIFDDENGTMNLSLMDIEGEILSISQFTLLGDVRKGKRPSYSHAAKPDVAKELYEIFNEILRKKCINVETGIFQANMVLSINNDGPVTILLDSRKNF